MHFAAEVQDNQGGPNSQEELKQPASNDEEPEGGNTPEENKDETSSEELSEDKGPLEYVEDEYEVDDEDCQIRKSVQRLQANPGAPGRVRGPQSTLLFTYPFLYILSGIA
ncbi:hypothetical protein OG21DRAFT_1489895 [Imleria badia]|nr:hypothetical protein OG21DRAFT_1489895 [Imleria badia]